MAKLNAVLVVVTFDPRLLEPAPFWVNAPLLASAAAFAVAVVNVPEFVTVVVPATVQPALTVRFTPVKAKLPV